MYHESHHRYDARVMENTLLWVLAGGLMLAGLAGTLLPMLPGVPLVFAGMLLAAWIDGFSRIGVTTLVVLGVLAVLSFVVEYAAAALGANRAGASRQAMAGAAIGTFAGLFLGLPGLLLGPFVGAAIGELMARSGASRAVGVGVAAWIGFAVGSIAKLAIAFTMIGVFVAVYVFNRA
jgi:uncharacterized protein YqgC (DUF456 family)